MLGSPSSFLYRVGAYVNCWRNLRCPPIPNQPASRTCLNCGSAGGLCPFSERFCAEERQKAGEKIWVRKTTGDVNLDRISKCGAIQKLEKSRNLRGTNHGLKSQKKSLSSHKRRWFQAISDRALSRASHNLGFDHVFVKAVNSTSTTKICSTSSNWRSVHSMRIRERSHT